MLNDSLAIVGKGINSRDHWELKKTGKAEVLYINFSQLNVSLDHKDTPKRDEKGIWRSNGRIPN